MFVLKAWVLARFGKDERGATLVEYVLLIALIALAVMGTVLLLGGQLNSKFSEAGSKVSVAPNNP